TTKPLRGLSDNEFVNWLVHHQYGFGTTGFVLEAEAVRSAGGFDETQVRRHDWELFSRVVKGRTWSFDPAPHWIKRPPRQGDISSDSCACKYFMLRGLVKMNDLYESRELEQFTRRAARHALSAAVRSGDATAFRRAHELASPRVGPFERAAFAAAMRFAFARALLNLRTARIDLESTAHAESSSQAG
ncbi:MAG: hypothetical protein WD873_00865, partial [Candidatus Hydrogenedentales bacterium]